MCAPPLDKGCSHAMHTKVIECINTRQCVLSARQRSGLQLDCSPLAHLKIETKICLCVAVAVCMKEGRQIEAPDLLTQLQLYSQECTERRKREQKGVREHAKCFECAFLGP